MKLLFSSSESDLVEAMATKLLESGVHCEVRYRPEPAGSSRFSGYRELWVKAHQELEWASRLMSIHVEAARN